MVYIMTLMVRDNDTRPRKEGFISARLALEEIERLKEIALQEDRTVSYVVRRAILRHLDEQKATA